MNDDEPKPDYSIGEASRLLGMDPASLRKWCRQKRIEAYKVPGGGKRGRWRIPRHSLATIRGDDETEVNLRRAVKISETLGRIAGHQRDIANVLDSLCESVDSLNVDERLDRIEGAILSLVEVARDGSFEHRIASALEKLVDVHKAASSGPMQEAANMLRSLVHVACEVFLHRTRRVSGAA